MRLLLDTNIFLEILLEQEKATEARALLQGAGKHEFFMSDFAFYSIGIFLFRRKQHDVFIRFVKDLTETLGVTIIALSRSDMASVSRASTEFGLDFDDAYQYTLAQKRNLALVTFDSDFNRTGNGHLRPSDITSR